MSDLTLDQLKSYLKDDTLRDADSLQDALDAAKQCINEMCERYFTQDSAVSVRYFDADNLYEVCVDDISTTTGLLVSTDDGLDGTYATSWTISTDFQVEPVNNTASGITVPYTKLRAVGTSKVFPIRTSWGQRSNIKVTAKWGWPAFPSRVAQAQKILAAELYKLADAPLGVAGYGEYGQIRVRENPKVRALLVKYMKHPYAVA